MRHKLQCTDRVSDTLEVVTLSVGKVIHRIGMPLSACAVVRRVDDTIDNRITEVHVGVSHIQLGTQHHASFNSLWRVHQTEQSEVLLYGSVTVGRSNTWLCGCSFLCGNLFTALFVDICLTLFDQPNGKIPQPLEIVTGVIDVTPVESEPLDIVQDRVDIFRILLAGVCVIKAKVTYTVIMLCHTKVHAYSLGMSDMQITIRLWRETGLNPTVILSFCKIFLY